jgi:murein DD-endopeptidase MepM/ murein hydrolase activator NlpD
MIRGLLLILAAFGLERLEGALQFSWPTDNTAYSEGLSFDVYVQPTVSGKTVSGLFGCVRSSSTQFHEGLDLKALKRDRHGEAIDAIRAIHDGVVRYVNGRLNNSTFGRYLVIEHTDLDLPIVSLYAHLSKVESGLSVGDRVASGQRIGWMGRTADGHSIPRERAHLHLETGLWLSRDFQTWYDRQEFGTGNRHGVFNGINTVGFDFHDLVDRLTSGEVEGIREYLLRQPTAVTVEWATGRIPDFVRRYPQLLLKPVPKQVKGWRVDLTWYGLPVRWTPLTETSAGRPGRVDVVFHDRELLARYPCLGLVTTIRGVVSPGARLNRLFELLFARRGHSETDQ